MKRTNGRTQRVDDDSMAASDDDLEAEEGRSFFQIHIHLRVFVFSSFTTASCPLCMAHDSSVRPLLS